MGVYLNPGPGKFKISRNTQNYVDKSSMILELNTFVNTENRFICISRPRRFGKTMAANMIAAYYDRSVPSETFEKMKIFSREGMRLQGKYDVLRMNMQEFLSRSSNVQEMLSMLQLRLCRELIKTYSEIDYFNPESLPEVLEEINAATESQFVFVIDEWDCIFREYPNDGNAQKTYLDFLRDLLKDKEYVALAYMTGILPIKKYGTHSALNMFSEYSMLDPGRFSGYVGFTETEVRELCEKNHMDFDDCSYWYNGYSFPTEPHVYNPRSIIMSMQEHRYADYWNQTENFEALKIYLDMNFEGLRDSVIEMLSGARVKTDTRSFQNDMTSFERRDDILTLLIHLGYLGYDVDTGEVFIPNHEIQMEFVTATEAGGWSEILNSVKESAGLLTATWRMQEDAVAAGMEKAHFETSHLQYNDENALSYTISLAYYAARQYYIVVREFPSGRGFADLVFLPRKKYAEKPAMVIELKWDKSADAAIEQIREKKYTRTLEEFTGNILLVSVNYDKTTKEHSCRIEKVKKP